MFNFKEAFCVLIIQNKNWKFPLSLLHSYFCYDGTSILINTINNQIQQQKTHSRVSIDFEKKGGKGCEEEFQFLFCVNQKLEREREIGKWKVF